MKFKFIIFLFTLCLGLAGCSKENNEPEVKPKRTVLAYIIANNSLSSFATGNLKSMIESASDKNLNGGNLLVYYAQRNELPRLLRIEETKENINQSDVLKGYIEEHTIKTYDSQNAVDPEIMQSIIRDAVTLAPADSYGLVLWSHGTSWFPSNLNSMLRAFGQDGSNWMEIDQLAQGIPDHFFDFILFDACYMANIECAYELKDKADYILASPTETMGTGWPYSVIMPYFFTETAQLDKAGEAFYNYYNVMSGDYRTATVSLVKTSELDNLANIVKEILSDKSEDDLYGLDRSSASMQRLEYLYKSGSYNPVLLYDFNDFISQLATPEQYTRFTAGMKNAIIYEAHTETAYFGNPQQSFPINRCSGLSVYVPAENYPKINAWYQEHLKWYKAVYK
ncbi:clostripain-related cysteine peptidase [Parabacteroides sp. AM08-6]|uniref:clostripain-related cysteine peptidase n=1 Tax=Parabacteroides sp. AM08-6 TaxID=2292053 RepID=UPI000EFE3AD6|nr:clostripain-related cysteine peptidase [Parabacteroides sp. AM08-6]RHJ78697.1 hypothetical protein DW103_14505 [Parabacteroides sp. AM08-6]